MIPHAPLLSDVDEREAVRQLMLLDPCSAWRADLADAGHTEPMDEALADQWLLWLQIATVFDRLRSLPVAARAAYARSTTALWETAERVTGAARFARVGAVMAAWEGAAPELAGFRELLWAVEQGEAEGALRVAYGSLRSLTANLAEHDPRRGYADAQRGRVLRTIGLNNDAQRAFDDAAHSAIRAHDGWLRVRVLLGLGALQHTRGNYPSAREIFGEALRSAYPHTDLICGAHLGLVTVARASKDYSMALEHGWHALQCARGVSTTEVEALTILAGLSLEVGEFAASLCSCNLAMSKSPGPRMRGELVRYMVQASLGLGDNETTRAHVPALISAVNSSPNPWQQAQGYRVLAEVFDRWGQPEVAVRHLEQARTIALKHGYKELLFVADKALERRSVGSATRVQVTEEQAQNGRTIELNEESQTVIGLLACLAES